MSEQVTQQQSRRAFKRLIVCCDGTWQNALGKSSDGPASNVTRISRVIKNVCSDGTHQVIMYDPGVGSNGTTFDSVTGGDFGVGLAENIREVYNFICTNYVDGDEIVLIGFSRGAFTARSVGDMIATMGLLTPDGLDHFYDIFEDYENMGDPKRENEHFLSPGLPPYQGQKGKARILWEEDRKVKYRQWLKQVKYTRDTYADGVTEITVKAIAVWDTVGSLGIPPAPVLGFAGSAKQWRFTHTQISPKIENAFQALALDEPRAAFRPALWERVQNTKTNLKQCWFPGSHSNVGGGWHDQQIADITLAWMCDQLTAIGIEFSAARLSAVFLTSLRYSAAHPYPYVPTAMHHSVLSILHSAAAPKVLPWANADGTILSGLSVPDAPLRRDSEDCPGREAHPPVNGPGGFRALWATARPWALGQIRAPTSLLQMAMGSEARRPGLGMRVDPETNEETGEPLVGTAERVHSSVRVRLACRGLGLDDREVWECKALKGEKEDQMWGLYRGAVPGDMVGPVVEGLEKLSVEETKGVGLELYQTRAGDGRWRWVYKQPKGTSEEGTEQIPQAMALPEEPLTGAWERLLLALTVGQDDVWRFAEAHAVSG